MTTEMWIIALTRVTGSLPVLRWPFYGAIIAILVDQSDLFMMNLLDLGGVTDYQTFDKYLDQVYLACFLLVALRWKGADRNVSIALYAYRILGFVIFEVTQTRGLLLFFPNLFEFWYLFVAARQQFSLDQRLSQWQMGGVLGGLFCLKMFQEYALHQAKWLDGFTAVEAVESIWRFVVPFQ
jgi:hypothetical protein